MSNLDEMLLQKVNRSEKSICDKCSHRFVCAGIDNQPCFECNQFMKEVVRCEKCDYYNDYYIRCDHPKGLPRIKENSFCSYGERKNND